jgi:hypothetical protein
MALLAGSPAIDKGANPLALNFDQRGNGFARVSGASSDIGAYEVQVGGGSSGSAVATPTLNEWMLALLACTLIAVAAIKARRQR